MISPLLLDPIALRQVRAKNRIVVSPMCQYSASDGKEALQAGRAADYPAKTG